MKNKKRGSTGTVLIMIITVLVIGIVVYVYMNNQKSGPLAQESRSSTETSMSPTPSTTMNTNSNSSDLTAGMYQYRDAQFGFSFWYPKTWTVHETGSPQYEVISGGTIVKNIAVSPIDYPSSGVLLQEYVSPQMSITDSSNCGPADGCPKSRSYRFDPSIHSWIEQDTDMDGSLSSTILSKFTNTMGGLHMLQGNARFGADKIVPLSATNFVVVSAIDAGGTQEQYLAQTLVATDPSVATPVSATDQAEVIHAEGLLYGNNVKKVGDWLVDNLGVYSSNGALIPGANQNTFRLVGFQDGFNKYISGYATDGTHVYTSWTNNPVLIGADPATFTAIHAAFQILYAKSSGLYGQSFAADDTTFAKDATHVWYEGRLVPGADPNTLVVTGNTLVADSQGIDEIAHDASHIFGLDQKGNFTVNGVVTSL